MGFGRENGGNIKGINPDIKCKCDTYTGSLHERGDSLCLTVHFEAAVLPKKFLLEFRFQEKP